MTRSQLINKLKKPIMEALNKTIRIRYKRKKDMEHELVGKVIKYRKASFIIRVNDELNIPIGYRNIVEGPEVL